MNQHPIRVAAFIVCVLVSAFVTETLRADTPPTTRPSPKPLSENVTKGLAWIAHSQLSNGAWAQGDESAAMGNTLDKIKGSPNVADTCMALRAMVRSGSTPQSGEYQDQVLKGIRFVCEQIEQANDKDLYVTELRGTRTQMKLGSYIDTFMATQLFGDVKNTMPDAATTKRVNDALAKVLKKMEANQGQDGRWANDGWAPVLAQGQAVLALNNASQNGAAVNEKTRAAAEQLARADFNGTSDVTFASGGTFGGGASSAGTSTFSGATLTLGGTAVSTPTTGPVAVAGGMGVGRGGDVGVELYTRASQIAAMQSSANTNGTLRAKYASAATQPTTSPSAQAEAVAMLRRFDACDADLAKAQEVLINRLHDKQFVAGFGSNGGEEFLSYLNIGESLVVKGGDAWGKWDKSITENINRVQNDDGSWTGHHCITGRTFCTSAALLVLTIDRAPTPFRTPATQPTTQPDAK